MKILFWLNRSRATLYCRITVNGSRAEISTGVKVTDPSLWDSKRQVLKTFQDIKLTEMKLFFLRQQVVQQFQTAEKMKQAWEDKEKVKQVYPSPKLLSIVPEGYKGLIKHLKSFNDNPRLNLITQTWADKFARYLESRVQPSSAKVYLDKLRASLRRAMKDYPKGPKYPEMISKIPFEGPELSVQLSDQGERPKYLNLSQYEALKSLKVVNKDTFYLNCFLWQCATGQSFVDMKNFSGNCIFRDVTGEKYIKYRRQKTFIEAIIPIGAEILTAMHNISDWQLVRDLTERTYNRALRKIGEQIGFKRMTSHVARHTFGVLRLIDGYTMESVAKQLGHGSIRVTEKVYAQITVDKIFKEKRERDIG